VYLIVNLMLFVIILIKLLCMYVCIFNGTVQKMPVDRL